MGFVDAVLDDLGVKPAPLPVDTATPLTAYLPAVWFWRVTIANYHDEASYSTATTPRCAPRP